MVKALVIFALVIAVLAAIASCAPLKTFNLLTPKDGGVRRVVSDAAYGPGPRQRLDVYAPAGAGKPIIVFFYGGSWSSGEKADYTFAADALAARGFVVVVPDYRLVPDVVFPTFLEDGAAAIRWASDHAAEFGGDPKRIVLMGHSAGAYLAIMLALNRSYLSKAGVPAEAIKGGVGLSGPYDFYPFDVPASQNAFGQAPDPAATQPINFARADVPPLLLLHGDKDTLVRPRNTINLAKRLADLGAPVESHIYPVDHGATLLALSRPFRGKAPVLSETATFLKKVTAQ